ncbi:Proteasome subunit alpha type-4 [Conglomerata obtusa]
MSYDTALAIFSPDGRLIQVERAQHASEQGGVVVFTKTDNGIFLSVERRKTLSMMIKDSLSKLFIINICAKIFMSFCGLSPDALCIRNRAQLIRRQYKYDRGEDMNVEQLDARIPGEMQKNIISGGKRLYRGRTLIMG